MTNEGNNPGWLAREQDPFRQTDEYNPDCPGKGRRTIQLTTKHSSNREPKGQYQKICKAIQEHKHFTILMHNSMDGDTLGSALALAFALKGMNKTVTVVKEEGVPDNLAILPGLDFLADFSEDAKAGILSDAADSQSAVLVVDTGDTVLLGKRRIILENASCIINIDHHLTNIQFGDINLVEDGFSATAEVVFLLIEELKVPLSFNIAACVYAGICTDTGGFKYGNTTAQTHEIVAKLLQFPLNVEHMHFCFFDVMSINKLRCLQVVVNQLKFYLDGKLALVVITGEDFRRYEATPDCCEGLVNIGRCIQGAEVSILAKEVEDDVFRISFRSHGGVDVSTIAQRFAGGGHRAASGCLMKAAAAEVEQQLVFEVRRLLEGESKPERSC